VIRFKPFVLALAKETTGSGTYAMIGLWPLACKTRFCCRGTSA